MACQHKARNFSSESNVYFQSPSANIIFHELEPLTFKNESYHSFKLHLKCPIIIKVIYISFVCLKKLSRNNKVNVKYKLNMLYTIKVEYYYATLCLAEDLFLFLAERLLHDFISSLSFAWERDRMFLCVHGFRANLKITAGECTFPKSFTMETLLAT